MHDEDKMLFPKSVVTDNVDTLAGIRGFDLFTNLPPGGYFHLHTVWNNPELMPKGYDYYVVSFHLEHIDFEWLEKQYTGIMH